VNDQGITIDWDQLFADLRAVIATSGLPLAKAFESLPVGKYMKLTPAVGESAVSDAAVSSSDDARAQGRG
jgi:hypothetical protein